MVDYTVQDFNIVSTPAGAEIDACAFFKYKGYSISMSTNGRSAGACLNTVCVFADITSPMPLFEGSTVEECIDFVNNLD